MAEIIKYVDKNPLARFGVVLVGHGLGIHKAQARRGGLGRGYQWLIKKDGWYRAISCDVIDRGKGVIRFKNHSMPPTKSFWPLDFEVYPEQMKITLHKSELDDETLRKVIRILSGHESVDEWGLIKNNRGWGNYSEKAWLAGQGLALP